MPSAPASAAASTSSGLLAFASNPAHTGCASEADEDGTADEADEADVAGEDALVDGRTEDALGDAEVAGVELLVARPADVRAAGAPGMPAAAGPRL